MNDFTNSAFRKIALLCKSVRALGLLRGLRYWELMLDCEKEPGRVLELADLCDQESERCKLNGDLGGHWAMDAWAKRLRHQHAVYISANNPS